MSAPAGNLDLIVLVAGGDDDATIHALLTQHEKLHIRRLAFDVRRHPERDPGVRREPEVILRPFLSCADKCLVIFDRVGSGAEHISADELERGVEQHLLRNGWSSGAADACQESTQRRCGAIVIDPELESWVWSDSPHVATVLGWENQQSQLRPFLQERGLWNAGARKPHDPKSAMLTALKEKNVGKSSSTFGELARRVSFARCEDRSFLRLLQILRAWFPLP